MTQRPTTSPSLWDDHKSRAKRALQEAAVQLFAAKGYETTTIDEIAETARVSKRTFFRYFPTKESVLFVADHKWGELFSTVFATQPDTQSDVDAIRATFIELASSLPRSSVLLREVPAGQPIRSRGTRTH